MKHIRSRIKTFISPELMKALKDICTSVKISDNNTKVRLIREALEDHKLDYNELGPGTNRFAILIDGYVFKIAMDNWGVLDNDNEFSMTEVLQPFVTTVYETNGLISVSEYVTLMGKDEFIEKKNDIIKILSILSEGFLLGDVGYAPKNFANWGYRTDGSLVILDFAYIYNIVGDEIMCQKDGNILQYDENFNFMRCPYCRKKYDTIAIRRLIPSEHEHAEIQQSKNAAYALKTEMIEVEDEEDIEEVKVDEINKEEIEMSKEYTDKERQEGFMNIFNAFGDPNQYKKQKQNNNVDEIEPEDVPEDRLSSVVNTVASSPRKVYEPEPEEDYTPVYTDPLAAVIGAFSNNNNAFRKKAEEEIPEPEPEEVNDEEESRMTPLEMMMVQAGFDPEIEDVNNNEIQVEQRDVNEDDGIEENPEDYVNPGQVTYNFEEPTEEIEDVASLNQPLPEPIPEIVEEIIEVLPEEVIQEEQIEEEEVVIEEEEVVIEEEEVIDGDAAGEEIAPVVQITNVASQEEQEVDHAMYELMMDEIVYPEDNEEEEVNNEEVEEVQTSGIKRIGEFTTEEPVHETQLRRTNPAEIDESDDIMNIVNQVHNDGDKFDKLAQDHLGKDPYDY